MNAGRELDALVAEKVMGFSPVEWSGQPGDMALVYGDQETGGIVPRYSTNVGAAWQVVEKMSALSWRATVCWAPADAWNAEERAVVTYSGGETNQDDIEAIAPTVPLAICLAALKVVERS